MSRIILLDSSPLGLLTAPPGKPGPSTDCTRWLAGRLAAGDRVLVPEITDYETRRELVRVRKVKSIGRLDALAAAVGYLPPTTAVMGREADLWATAREDRPTHCGGRRHRRRHDPVCPGAGPGAGRNDCHHQRRPPGPLRPAAHWTAIG